LLSGAAVFDPSCASPVRDGQLRSPLSCRVRS
jgi:hypothetical protein